MRNVLFAISGPSGVGKGTLVKMLLDGDENLVASVSCTTRAPRAGETDGKDYFFLSRPDFEKKIAAGGFLEYDEHFGNYYGTPLAFVEKTLQKKSVILEIDVQGAMSAKAKKKTPSPCSSPRPRPRSCCAACAAGIRRATSRSPSGSRGRNTNFLSPRATTTRWSTTI